MTFRPPNVVLITCHDLGRHIGCYGVKTVSTPNIDALARSGVRFAKAFAVAPQCSPSRATIYTGRYPHANGVMGLAHAGFDWELNPGELHLSNLLKQHGWYCVLVGLQHETRDPQRMEYERIVMAEVPSSATVAEDASRVIRDRAAEDQPLYLQVGFFEPHRPFDSYGAQPDDSLGVTVPPYLVDEPSARSELAAFQGAIRHVDAAVGQVMHAIERAGASERTIVLFTTDHGIPFPRAKASLYDPGIEVCLVISCSGRHWPTEECDQLISNVDYLPTILELCGVQIPGFVQGRSFAALVEGGRHEQRSEVFAEMTYHDYYDPRRCIRTSTHKLIVNFSSAPFFMDPSNTWRPATAAVRPKMPAFHPLVELYDLQSDPLELGNVADDPTHAVTRDDLLDRLYRWMRTTKDPLLSGVPPSPRHKQAVDTLTAPRRRLTA